jgi:hypothetical protein
MENRNIHSCPVPAHIQLHTVTQLHHTNSYSFLHINKARLLYLHRMPLSISDISALSRETRAHDLDQSQAQRKQRGQLVLID